MPFEIVRNDITNMWVDAIVNTANPKVRIGKGVDEVIHKKAGAELFEARKKIGEIEIGKACITPAYKLDAKYVIHTVGPLWQGGSEHEIENLKDCYTNSLKLAKENRCKSIAFPLISTGTYGLPKDVALETAIGVFSEFLLKNEMMIYLVVFDKKSYKLSEKLFNQVKAYVDENYVEQNCTIGRREYEALRYSESIASYGESLQYIIDKTCEETFSQALNSLMIEKDMDAKDVYKRANMDRKLFSKIRNNMDYKPSKVSAVALAIGLKLNLEETKEFIKKAGFALTHSQKFDVVVEFFIKKGNYDVFEINQALFEHEQPLIGQ